MKLLKPNWVNHEDKPIFSVDIHPAGKRFATGGQGGDSGRVVVWNMSPVLLETCELDPDVPKMLCQMDNHLACVNCVRWSNNGRYLASGGDDRLVMVWALSGSAAGTNHKAETWRCVSTLRGHAGDVLDLAWSPLDKWLASCSVDNSIIIWNAEKFPDMVCVLNGHTGLVKGVAWDPVGKYLASQSDDKSLRVWKTADWVQESVITEPFEECGGTTHVLRLSWSPDGQYVVSAHAMNGGGPTALVLERDGWRCDKDFVGHRRAVTCARFNSNIFVKDGKKCCCAAVGSRDRALSIWLTSLKRPLVVVHELFTDSVLDISWSSDGLNLLACSSDGSVACIQFTNKEIGTPLTLDEKNAFYEKIYGKCLTQEGGDNLANSLLLECPEILLAREKTKDELNNKLNNSANKINTSSTPLNISRNSNSSSLSPVRPIDRQIETRTSDGKRRITPVFIPNIPINSESLGSAPTGPDACFSTSSQSKSRIRVERRDDIVIAPNVSNFSSASNHATGLSNRKQDENTSDNVLRKRDPLPGLGPAPSAVGVPPLLHPVNLPYPPAPAQLPPAPVATGPLVRPVGPHCRIQVVNNAVSTPYGALSRIQLLQNNSASTEPLWETYLGSAIVCVCTSAVWVMCATTDGTLHAWRLTGLTVTRAMPPIALLSRPVKMCVSGGVAAVATCNGELCMFDVTAGISLQRPPAFTALLTPAVTLTNLTLLDDGNPMITLSNGRCYIYCKRLCAWIVWQDSLDPIWRASRGSSVLRPPTSRGVTSHTHPLYPHNARQPHVPPGTHTNRGTYAAGATRAWLEAQTSACLQLRLAHDYRHWSLALLTHLAQHGTEQQLRAILDDMIGPSHCTSTPKKWQSTVLGIKKHELVEEMLTVLVRQLRWQRLYTEYNDQLNLIKSTSNGVVNGH